MAAPATPQYIYRRPWLAAYQTAAFFCPERISVIEATTKAGKTTGGLVWLTEQAMAGSKGQNFWWVSPTFGQAKIVYRRLKRALPEGLFIPGESEQAVTLANEAVLWFKGCDHPDSLYGEDVYAAVMDEATRARDDAFHAVRSTLTATRGPLRIIGNVKGRQNWAYLLARKAEGGAPDLHYAKITAYDAVAAGLIAAEEVEDAKSILPERVFRELYLAEPSDDGGNPFGLAAIAKCVGAPGDLPPVAWGIDLAKSSDWTVAIGLSANGRVCQFARFQLPWEETIARLLQMVGTVPALVDSTGVGDPVLEALQKRGRESEARFTGFKFSSSSKQQLMEGLALAIQQGEVGFPDGPIRAELETFEFEYTKAGGVRYSAPEGLHDDCVCSLALAVAHWRARRPMTVWGGNETVVEDEEQRKATSEAFVKDRIKQDGWYWPVRG